MKMNLAVGLKDLEGKEISNSEKEIIKKVCESGRMTILIAAQILGVVNNSK